MGHCKQGRMASARDVVRECQRSSCEVARNDRPHERAPIGHGQPKQSRHKRAPREAAQLESHEDILRHHEQPRHGGEHRGDAGGEKGVEHLALRARLLVAGKKQQVTDRKAQRGCQTFGGSVQEGAGAHQQQKRRADEARANTQQAVAVVPFRESIGRERGEEQAYPHRAAARGIGHPHDKREHRNHGQRKRARRHLVAESLHHALFLWKISFYLLVELIK